MSRERLNQELDAVEQRLMQAASAELDAGRRAQFYATLADYVRARANLASIVAPYLPEQEAPPAQEPKTPREAEPTPHPPKRKRKVGPREKPTVEPEKREVLEITLSSPEGPRTFGFIGDAEKALVSRLLEASSRHVSTYELGTAIYGKGEAKELHSRGMLTNRITATVAHIRKRIEPDRKNPVYLVSEKGKGYSLRAEVVEQKEVKPEGKLYTLPEAARIVGLSQRNAARDWLRQGLLEKGVHFIGRGGKKRIQRRITEEGLQRMRAIKRIKADKPKTVAKAVLRKLQAGPPFVRPETEHIRPEKVTFSEEEMLKLAHRLSDAAARLEQAYGTRVSSKVHQVWEQFRDSGGTLKNPEAAVHSLEQKLLSLAQDPAKVLPNFSGNYPVEETLMMMYRVAPSQREEFLKRLLYPENHIFVGRWSQPVEKLRKGKNDGRKR